jgi:hypothetical protein
MESSNQYPASNEDATFDVVDCWAYDAPTGNTAIRQIHGSGVDAWLAMAAPQRDGISPFSGLRLVVGRQTSAGVLAFTESQLKLAVKDTELLHHIERILASSAALSVSLMSEDLNPGKIPI